MGWGRVGWVCDVGVMLGVVCSRGWGGSGRVVWCDGVGLGQGMWWGVLCSSGWGVLGRGCGVKWGGLGVWWVGVWGDPSFCMDWSKINKNNRLFSLLCSVRRLQYHCLF